MAFSEYIMGIEGSDPFYKVLYFCRAKNSKFEISHKRKRLPSVFEQFLSLQMGILGILFP